MCKQKKKRVEGRAYFFVFSSLNFNEISHRNLSLIVDEVLVVVETAGDTSIVHLSLWDDHWMARLAQRIAK